MKKLFFFLFLIIIVISCNKEKPLEPDDKILSLKENLQNYYGMRDYESMLLTVDSLIALLDKDSMPAEWIDAEITKGVVYDVMGKYDSATYYLYDALALAEEKDNKEMQIKALLNTGILYFDLRKADEAISMYEKALILAEEKNDSISTSRILNNIANTYMTLKHDYDKAISYFEKSIELSEQMGYEDGRVTGFGNLAQIYLNLGEIDKALDIAIEMKAIASANYYIDYLLGSIYHKSEEYDKAIESYNYVLSNSLNTRELYLVILKELSTVYSEKGDCETSLEYMRQYQLCRDSIHSLETETIIQDLKISYETEKKEMQISVLNEERQLYLILTIIMVVGLILLFIVLMLLARNHRQKRIIMREEMQRLEQEKELTAAKSLLDGENIERTRLSRELHDGLGGLLTMIKLDLGQVKQSLMEDSQKIENIINLADKSVNEMRRMAHSLMPESLDNFGLRQVLEEFCSEAPNVKFHFYGEDKRLNKEIEINIYRIATELINNALKHSGASEINVQLIITKEKLSLTVHDNGKGFDVKNLHGGFVTVRSRVEFIGAQINIYSEKDKGSEIMVELLMSGD